MTRVDPEVRAVLDQLAAGAQNTGKIDRTESDDERRAAIDGDPLFKRASSTIAAEVDLEVPGPHGPVPVRVYVPSGPGPFPVVAYFHGGGFHSGSLDMYDASCRDLAAGSAALFMSVDYRLAPESTFPIPLDDCYAATDWLSRSAGQFGGDGSRLAVMGGSAGGNLAGAVALMARDRQGPEIRFQVLLFPAAGLDPDSPSMSEFAEGYWLTRDTVEYCWETYLPRAADRHHPYASLVDADLTDLPPALVLTAECDPLRDVAERYAALLAQSGVPTRLSRYFGMIHGFTLMSGVITRGREAIAEVAANIADALGSSLSRASLLQREVSRETVRRYFEDHLTNGDLDSADGLHAADYTWHAPNGRSLDRGQTSRFVRRLYASHDDVGVEIHDLIAEGDGCVARFTMTGRQVGEWNGRAAEGQRLHLRGQILCRVRDGQIAESWELVVEDEWSPTSANSGS